MTDPTDGSVDRGKEDLIESVPRSAGSARIWNRLDRLIPARVERKYLAGIAIMALVVGMGAGYLVGAGTDPNTAATGQTDARTGPPPDGGYIPFIPDGSPFDEGAAILSSAGLLTPADLIALGERTLPIGGVALGSVSGLDGLCTWAEPAPPAGAAEAAAEGAGYSSVTFLLAGASLDEVLTPDLGASAEPTLRSQVALAEACSDGDRETVQTDGVQQGIGDEYAAFVAQGPDPATGTPRTRYIVLVRVGGQLIEVSLATDVTTDVTDGRNRALRIAEAAVARLLAP